jgi:hypothetical protein
MAMPCFNVGDGSHDVDAKPIGVCSDEAATLSVVQLPGD